MTFATRWQRVRNRTREGGVVPLVGAGISRAAKVGVYPDLGARFAGFEPTVVWLQDVLRDGLREVLRGENDGQAPIAQRLADSLRGKACRDHALDPNLWWEPLVGEVPHCWWTGSAPYHFDCVRPDLSRLVEVLRALRPAFTVTDLCGMERFEWLEPLIAHRAIARLGREGFLREVITTNYDCCLERAYRATFDYSRDLPAPEAAPALDAGEEAPPHHAGAEGYSLFARDHVPDAGNFWPATVVTEAHNRQYTGRRFVGTSPASKPLFRVVKLNGCARHWRQRTAQLAPLVDVATLERESLRIALSDSDLHELGEGWKQDYLGLRARTHTLLLSGFGADEAQIRYTLLRVLREELPGHGNDAAGTEAQWAATNAPFVHGYGANPTYAQGQILSAFAGRSPHGGVHDHDFDTWNFVGGDDSPQFPIRRPPHTGAPPNLSADRFWERLYADTIRFQLAARIGDGDSEAGVWMRSSGAGPLGGPDVLAQGLVAWIKGPGLGTPDEGHELYNWGPLAPLMLPCQSTPELPYSGQWLSVWDQVLRFINGGVAAGNPLLDWGTDIYRPLREHERVWAALAFTIRALAPAATPDDFDLSPGYLPILSIPGAALPDHASEPADFAVLLAESGTAALGPWIDVGPGADHVTDLPGVILSFPDDQVAPGQVVVRSISGVFEDLVIAVQTLLPLPVMVVLGHVRASGLPTEAGAWLTSTELLQLAAALPQADPTAHLISEPVAA